MPDGGGGFTANPERWEESIRNSQAAYGIASKNENPEEALMWTCPKCGREFESRNQHHFCVEPPQTIDAYIAAQPESVRPLLNQIRNTLRKALPDAKERISWRMPTFWQGHNLLHFAAFKKHIGLYPGEQAVAFFSDRLTGYKTSKGAIRFPCDRPIPFDLIAEIAIWRYENEAHR